MSDAMNDRDLQKGLDAIASNPREVMLKIPEKRDANGKPLAKPSSLFSQSAIQSGDFVQHRDSVRKTFSTVVDGAYISLEDCIPGKAPYAANDRPESLADTIKYTDLASMEAAGLMQAQLPVQPWSDDYWGLYRGCLGKRYGDPEFPDSQDWKEHYTYVTQNAAQGIVSEGNEDLIDLLSPAEKYDLLIGDASGNLTRAMWAQGQSYYDRSGAVETWMGICHGWAPAAYMLPRPKKPITVIAADGKTELTFYPADLKALASLLWAQANMPTRFVGGRCNEKDPEVDENGRFVASAALDTNPGTWHLVVVNQIGVAKRSFVMDATYDYEVWNQPVSSYEYRYFNPQTLQLAGSLAEATVSKAQFQRDLFKKFRSPQAVNFVGIVMEVSYIREHAPEQTDGDGPENDVINTVVYKYDLELDASGRILGGEWYTGKSHPDFLWTPAPGTRAFSAADQYATGSWDSKHALPQSWRTAAISAASRGMPLGKLVEALLALANQ